jgi:hypothetical protein
MQNAERQFLTEALNELKMVQGVLAQKLDSLNKQPKKEEMPNKVSKLKSQVESLKEALQCRDIQVENLKDTLECIQDDALALVDDIQRCLSDNDLDDDIDEDDIEDLECDECSMCDDLDCEDRPTSNTPRDPFSPDNKVNWAKFSVDIMNSIQRGLVVGCENREDYEALLVYGLKRGKDYSKYPIIVITDDSLKIQKN